MKFMKLEMSGKCIIGFIVFAVLVPGCIDPVESIVQNLTRSPISSFELSEEVKETSGLIVWDSLVWTHNDHSDTRLFGLNGATGEIIRVVDLGVGDNNDWESITQDENNIYIGDFGNNTGSRDDLHILMVEKASLFSGFPHIDTIWFSYSNQLDMNPVGSEATDFDCEAFVVSEDSIYLFTKQWLSAGTAVYVLPKSPGIHTAVFKEHYDIQGLVTDATYLAPENLLVLCGYTPLLSPFLDLLRDFNNHDFFSGNIKRVNISLPFHQVEGLATENGRYFYLSNEKYGNSLGVASVQKLHIFDLSDLTKL